MYALEKPNNSTVAVIEDNTPAVHYATESTSYYYMAPAKLAHLSSDEKSSAEDEEKRDLVRISSCAFFHKLSAGMGVPHSFVGKYAIESEK